MSLLAALHGSGAAAVALGDKAHGHLVEPCGIQDLEPYYMEATSPAGEASPGGTASKQRGRESRAGRDTDWVKLLAKPGPFQPKPREQDVLMWRDRWEAHQYLCILDAATTRLRSNRSRAS